MLVLFIALTWKMQPDIMQIKIELSEKSSLHAIETHRNWVGYSQCSQYIQHKNNVLINH